MVLCAVPGCDSSKKNNPQNYSFHQFPVKPDVRDKWIRMVNRPKWSPHKYATICNFQCDVHNSRPLKELKENLMNLKDWQVTQQTIDVHNYSFATIKPFVPILIDPLDTFDAVIEQVVYGEPKGMNDQKLKLSEQLKQSSVDIMAHLPSGAEMRAEMFHNKSSVHLPFTEYLHRGHAYLKISRDHMQTAVDAFAIFLAGSIEDVMRLPPAYVLQSARTIAMMRIAREKLAATWLVVKGSTPTNEITYETLEKYRPLFKYVNAKEMARLDLLDKKILTFIGTHPDLSRHQVGVVANKYIQLNRNWTQARYLNVMNNLLCGVPMMVMRRVPKTTYLQLTHQLFYHIRACDPLQRKFYLQMMTRTQALGKSYSWSARDVSRLGLLLAEVDGPSLGAINPEAMTGITSQVMLQMPTEILLYLTEIQLRYIEPKALNILAKKISNYRSERISNSGYDLSVYTLSVILMSVILRSIV